MTPAYRRALEQLYARATRGMVLGLDAISAAAGAMGSPAEAYPVIHVAGTNGKGSTCAMLESIARTAGLRTGLYTSPHLHRVTERVRIGGIPVEPHALVPSLERALAFPNLSFFEVLTLAAMDAFREQAVDLAIVETGLGGRLDATNIVPHPIATVVTGVGLDHTTVLGNTFSAIAREKADILKAGSHAVVGPVCAEARDAVEHVVRSRALRSLTWITDGDVRAAPKPLHLMGAHQQENAAIANAVAVALQDAFPQLAAHAAGGIAQARWPGRFEQVRAHGKTWIFDCAHNPEGASALAAALSAHGVLPSSSLLIFGALADKDALGMLRELAACAKHRIFLPPAGRTPWDPHALASAFPGAALGSVEDALAHTTASNAQHIVVTGSSYLVGELRARLLGIECDPVVAL